MGETSIGAMVGGGTGEVANPAGESDLSQRRDSELEDEVATLAARVAVATARLLELLAELDRRGCYGGEGFTSLSHWLSWRTGLDAVAAREHVRVARALTALPCIAGAFRAGQLSYSKVRALSRVARPETEADLVEVARAASSAQLERFVRCLRRSDPEAEQKRAIQQSDRRGLDAFFDDDGMLVVRGRLAPEAGALVMRALDAARDSLFCERPRGVEIAPGQARADALAWMAERSMEVTTSPDDHRASDHTMVVVHVDREALADPAADGRCELEDGPNVSAETARRLACDCSRVILVDGSDSQVAASRRTRVLTAAQERALRERDGGHCTFPGCTHRILESHHARHWTNGGPTELSNLASTCKVHHMLVHEGGWRVEIGADGHVRWLRPDGRVQPDAPAPPLIEGSLDWLRRAAPTEVTAHSLTPTGNDTRWPSAGAIWSVRSATATSSPPSAASAPAAASAAAPPEPAPAAASAAPPAPRKPRRRSADGDAGANSYGGWGEWGPEDGYSPGGCTVDIWSM